jgi:hypothetical protein
MVMMLRLGAPTRAVTEIGVSDYVKVAGAWERVLANTAFRKRFPREWTIVTTVGVRGMWDVDLYAKAEDFEPAAAL